MKFAGLTSKYRSMPAQVKASLWFLICSFMKKGISALTTPIFTRLLSTTEYGQYGVFNSWSGIISVFVTLHLTAGVYTQGLIKFSDEREIFSSSIQGLTTTLTFAWTIVYLLFRDFWNSCFSLTTVQMLAMLVMMWASAAFGFWASEQRVKLNYKTLVAVTLCVSVLKPLVGIVLVTHVEDKVTARILGLALVELVCYSGFFVIQMRRGKRFFSKRFWKYALAFNIPLVPHYLSQTVLGSADRIMIEKMVGDSEAGIYTLAYSVSLVMTLFNSALMQTISPWVYQKIKDRKENEIARVAYIGLAIIALVNLALIALAPEIVRFFAPASYYDAIWVIPPVATSAYFMFAYDLFAKFEFYFEKTKWIAAATMGSALMNVILNYIFIKQYGYKAAGYTTLICYILYALFHYFCMQKVCKQYLDGSRVYDVRILIGMTAVFLILGFAGLALYNYLLLRYTVIVFALAMLLAFRKKAQALVNMLIKIKKNP